MAFLCALGLMFGTFRPIQNVVSKGYYLSNWELKLLSHLISSLACVAIMNNSRTAVHVVGFNSAAHTEVPIAEWSSSLLLRERIPLFNGINHYLRIDMGRVYDRARSQLPAKELKAVNDRWKSAAFGQQRRHRPHIRIVSWLGKCWCLHDCRAAALMRRSNITACCWTRGTCGCDFCSRLVSGKQSFIVVPPPTTAWLALHFKIQLAAP